MSERDDHSHAGEDFDPELMRLLSEADEDREFMNADDNDVEITEESEHEYRYSRIRRYAAKQTRTTLIDAIVRKYGYHDDLERIATQVFIFGAKQATNEWEWRHGQNGTQSTRQADYERATEYMELYRNRILPRGILTDHDMQGIIEFGRITTTHYLEIFAGIGPHRQTG